VLVSSNGDCVETKALEELLVEFDTIVGSVYLLRAIKKD